MVVAGVIPFRVLAKERKTLYEKKVELGRERAKEEQRKLTIREWQREWTNSTEGKCTRRRIPQVGPWIERAHG